MTSYHLLPRPDDRGGVTAAVYRLVHETIDGFSAEAGGFHSIGLGQYDLVHIHTVWLWPCWTTALLCRLLKIPYVFTPHGNLLGPALRQSAVRKKIVLPIVRCMFRHAAHVIINSEAERIAVLQFGCGTAKISLVPWGIDSVLEPPLHKKNNVRTVLYLGRISPEKNLETLLAAWRDLSPDNRWHLKLVGFSGTGRYETKIHRLAASVSGVEPLPACSYERRFDEIRGADILVLPSKCENFGFTVGEALACGVPVVVSDGTPWYEVVDRKCGICVGTSEAELGVGLRSVMALSDAEREEMGQCGRAWIQREFSWESAAKRMVEVYERVLSTKETK